MAFWPTRLALIAAALVLLGAGAYWTRSPVPQSGSWHRVEAEFDAGPLPLGEHVVAFRVENVSDAPARVLGGGAGCRPGVCFHPAFPGPITVAPGQSVDVPFGIDVTEAGPFEAKFLLFLSPGQGIEEVILTVRGTGVRPGGPSDAPTPAP